MFIDFKNLFHYSKEEGSTGSGDGESSIDNEGGDLNLDSLIKEGVSELKDKLDSKETKETKKEDEQEDTEVKDEKPKLKDKVEEKKDKKEIKKEDEVSDEDKQNKALLELLKNPEQRKVFLKSLAEREGLTSESTPKEEKKVLKTIESIIEDKIPEEYKFLKKHLKDVFTEIVDHIDEEKIAPVRGALNARTTKENNAEVTRGYDEAFSSFKASKELESLTTEIPALVRKFPIQEGQDIKNYFTTLLKFAAVEKGITLTQDTKKAIITEFNAERRERNREDASSRLASEGVRGEKTTTPKQESSYGDAVRKAAEAVAKTFKTAE